MDDEIISGVRLRPAAISWSNIRGGGPGGQHVNTSATTVVLRVALWGFDGLDGEARDRLRQAVGSRLTQADEIVLRCGLERDVARNREIVWQRLQALLRQAQRVPRRRRATKPTRGSVQRRLTGKVQQGQKKRRRGERFDADE